MEPIRLDDGSLREYLRGRGLLGADESATVEPAGDGNINWVRRVRAGDRSFVVKQARAALERFPEYEAPTERIVCEARYYDAVRALDRDRVCPAVIAFDEAARVLVLEDLGHAERLDAALARGADAEPVATRIARFLGAVHAATACDASLAARFPNDGMRRLHGDHIFVLPFAENGFPLPPAVRARAEEIWREGRVAAIGAELYERYLDSRGGALVHADVQAGNVLLAERGAVLLDAEIAHAGDPAFDLGTLFAHLSLPAVALDEASAAQAAIDAAQRAYSRGNPRFEPDDLERARRYAALEMLRRTLGAARVAAVAEAEASLRVVEFALARL
jgi:5-methylthioribose kinase